MHLVLGVRWPTSPSPTRRCRGTSIVGGASIYPFVQNLLLGSARRGARRRDDDAAGARRGRGRELLAIPEEVALAAHIGVGHRADPWPKQLSRKPVEEFAFAERFGEPL